MAETQQLEKSTEAVPLGSRAKNLLGNATAAFGRMNPKQRSWGIVAAATTVALLMGLIWYATRTDWRTLYAGLDPEDTRQIAAQLTAAQIPYDVSPDGTTLRVSSDKLDKARLATTAKGGPKSGRMGFELFDKPNWMGSEFDEKVNYQRALEGELEHTIATLGDVQSARVHLVLPHDSLFSEQQRDAKASVVLKLKRRSLSEDQADSIRNLVAAAVDGLRPENVVMVDADGHLPLGPKNAEAETAAREQALTEKLVETLEPVTGAGNVRASVNVEYSPDTADEVDETYDPNSSVTLTMQRSEQLSGPQAGQGGIPGTVSNSPNAQNSQLPLYPGQTTPPQSVKQETGTYGASKKVRHSIESAGKIRRLTVAVLVNDKLTAPATLRKGAVWQRRSPDEIKNLTELAEAAVGFDSQRGDQVSVQNISFEENSEFAPPSMIERVSRQIGPIQEWLKYGTILLGILLVIVLVARPALKRLPLSAQSRTESLSAKAQAQMPVVGVGEQLTDSMDPVLEQQKLHAQNVFDTVTEQLKRDPAQTSRLLQSWIHSE
jgi:flagellar M-ring protein FliF